MATVRFRGGNRNGRPARCALPPASGLEIVRQEAAENRVGALGGKPFLANLAGNTRRYRGGRSPYRRFLRFLAPAGQLGCGRTPAAVEDPRWRPATLTDWLMAVRGPALVSVTVARPRAFLPVWLMFLQHRMRCVSTIRWRASLTILAGVVLIAAEGRAS